MVHDVLRMYSACKYYLWNAKKLFRLWKQTYKLSFSYRMVILLCIRVGRIETILSNFEGISSHIFINTKKKTSSNFFQTFGSSLGTTSFHFNFSVLYSWKLQYCQNLLNHIRNIDKQRNKIIFCPNNKATHPIVYYQNYTN